MCCRRRGQRVLQTPVDKTAFDDAHGLSVQLQRRYAIVLAGERVGRHVAERAAVHEQEQVAVAREMVADHGEALSGRQRERTPLRAVQHVVAVEPEVLDATVAGHGQALDRVDFVVQQVKAAHVRQPGERVHPDHAQVRVLDGQDVHVAQPPERVRFQ